jgi:methylmalonyl-CoA mutase N-terminal domain/subunit
MAVEKFKTDSSIPVKRVYSKKDVKRETHEEPGKYPYTRGLYPNMYRERVWTMRQYSGFGSAEETNKRFKFLLDHGQTGLSLAFDLPTQTGRDSDDTQSEGEVGRTGVAISSIKDMMTCFDGIPLYDHQLYRINPPIALHHSRRISGRHP